MRGTFLVMAGVVACSARTGGDEPPPGAGGSSGSSGAAGAGGSGGTPISSFPLPPSIELGGDSGGVAVADLDGDGFVDLATLVKPTGEDRARLVLAYGDDGGLYADRFEHDLAGTVTRAVRGTSSSVAIGDLDGDGRLDVATAAGVALGTTTRQPSWRSFGSEAAHAFQPVVIAKLDVLVAIRGGADGYVERCSESGACEPLAGQTPACLPGEGCAIEDLVTGDFDGDSHADVLAGSAPSAAALERSWLWTSLDGWAAPVAIDELSPVDLEAGDVDQDGVSDVVAQRRSLAGAPAETEVWIGAPGGVTPFVRVQRIANQYGHNDASALADGSFDTCLDILHVSADDGAVAVRLGSFTGDGCTEYLGPHDASAAVDSGWSGHPGAPGTLGIQQLDASGDGIPDWILRAPPGLRFVAVPVLDPRSE
jgi:hypothetical protein